jgi:hypothetical protein
MTFFKPENSTTADSSDINDDFYHIGQGSRSPYSGVLLSKTTAAYDIGSGTYKWDSVYCNNVKYYNSSIGSIKILSTILVSSSVERVEFTSISDSNEFLMVRMSATYPEPTATGKFILTFSGVSSSIYYNEWCFARGTAITSSAKADITAQGFYIGEYIQGVTTETQYCNSVVIINNPTTRSVISGNIKYHSSVWSCGFGDYVYEACINNILVTSGVNTISTIAIEGRFAAGSTIELLSKG